MFVNKNANNPNAWTYEPDLDQPAFKDTHYQGGDVRVTWQVTPRNKLGILAAEQTGCTCVGVVSATVAPEADIRESSRSSVASWSTGRRPSRADSCSRPGEPTTTVAACDCRPLESGPQMITVNEQSSGLRYRAADNFRNGPNHAIHLRFAASYITGSHAYQGRHHPQSGI